MRPVRTRPASCAYWSSSAHTGHRCPVWVSRRTTPLPLYVSTARTLDFILHGIEEFTAITIVSAVPQPIKEAIIEEMGRTVTIFKAHGGKSGEDREI